MHTSTGSRVPLNYYREGKGNITLIFLHFFAGSGRSWAPLIDLLKPHFDCVAIDLYGFGDSPAPTEQLSLAESARQVLYLIEELPLRPYVLLGHSMGGKIALQIASQVPSNLTSLILIAPSPPSPEPMSERARDNMMSAFGKREDVEIILQQIIHTPLTGEVFKELLEDHLKASETGWMGWLQKGSREDILEKMQQIKVPVLVLSGQFDPNFSTKFLKSIFSACVPHSTFAEILQAGHLIPQEAPDAVAKEIIAFLSQ